MNLFWGQHVCGYGVTPYRDPAPANLFALWLRRTLYIPTAGRELICRKGRPHVVIHLPLFAGSGLTDLYRLGRGRVVVHVEYPQFCTLYTRMKKAVSALFPFALLPFARVSGSRSSTQRQQGAEAHQQT